MQINTRDLTPGERIQLAGVLLQAWTAFQQQSHHQESSQCALSIPRSRGSIYATLHSHWFDAER